LFSLREKSRIPILRSSMFVTLVTKGFCFFAVVAVVWVVCSMQR
jgi:hypothetical protein